MQVVDTYYSWNLLLSSKSIKIAYLPTYLHHLSFQKYVETYKIAELF